MKIKFLTTIFSLFILIVTAFGQDELSGNVSGIFPDTIKIGKEKYKRIYSLDSIEGVIIDTLTNPYGFVFRTPVSSRDVALYFARKKENYFLVYQLGNWSSLSDFKFERVDFNGTGTKELLMINKQEKKHSPDNSEDQDYVEKWLSIWDLDGVEMLALFHNYISHHLWQKNSVVMKSCFNLIPSIKKKEIIFNQSGKCDECNEGIDIAITKPIQIKYKLTANGLIKTSESGGMYHRSKMGYLVPNVSGKYKLYTDKDRGFSFQIPVEWAIQKDQEGEDAIAVPIEKDSANRQYFENGFFTIAANGQGVCDSLYMIREGFSGNDSAFYTYSGDYINSGKPEDIYQALPIKGKNWKGYAHVSPCGQLMNDRRDFHGDICESIYFYDGKHYIIKIYTTGNELNEKAREKLIESFKFFLKSIFRREQDRQRRTKSTWRNSTIMNRLTVHLLATFFVLTSCDTSSRISSSNPSSSSIETNTMETPIDKTKREIIVKKYDLMKFPNLKQPILLTIDEFFDGNNDEASIAPNLTVKPKVSEYYRIFKKLSENPKVIGSYVKISEVMIYEGGKLNDNEWFYSDMIYIVGDITKEEVKEATKSLLPDEVEYDTESGIKDLDEKYKDKDVVYVWWD